MTAGVLSGCSSIFSDSILSYIKHHYEVKDNVSSSLNPNDPDQIFVAKNQTIPTVASDLKKAVGPKKISQFVNNKQVLVYDNYFVTLTKDQQAPNNTLIEVASYDFVRENYRPSFFDGLLTYYMLNNLLGVNNWASRQHTHCLGSVNGCYQGYNHSGGHYKAPSSKPLFRSRTIRGGGPNAGK